MKLCQRFVVSASLAALVFGSTVLAENSVESQPARSKADIEKIVREYLLNNPEILVQVAQNYQKKQAEMQQKMAEQAIKDNAASLFNDKNSPSAGNAQGNIVLVEFFDYQCGHCKRMTGIVKELIDKNEALKVVYKELPIFGGESLTAAKYALAAHKAGSYDAVHTAFMGERAKFSPEKIDALLQQAGVDKKALVDDKQLAQFAEVIEANKMLAAKLGIRGTPAFVIASDVGKSTMQIKFIPGAASLQQLQSAIDALSAS